MPKLQSIKRSISGLVTNPNALSEAPDGALAEAVNCVCDRPGIVSKRRGYARFGESTNAAGIFELKLRRVLFEDLNSRLVYDSDNAGTWAAYPGTVTAPDSSTPVRGMESQATLYLTTSAGVKRTDEVTSAPVAAGIPGGLDLKLTKTGIGAGWFSYGQVGYRVIFGRVDANDRLLRGAPSMREVVVNVKATLLAWARSGGGPYTITVTHTAHGYATSDVIEIADSTAAGLNGPQTITVTGANSYTFSVASDPGASGTLSDYKKHDVIVEITLPDDIEEGDFWDLYRTDISASSTSDPGDRPKRVLRYPISGTSATFAYSAGTVTVTSTAHGLASGDLLRVYMSSDPLFDGRVSITVTGANTFTYATSATPPATGNGKYFKTVIIVTDDWDLPLGEELYTNPSQEGILKANSRPPIAKDMALYRGQIHYLNTKKEQYLPVQLIEIAGLVDDTSSIRIVLGSSTRDYTFSTAENVAAKKFQRVTSFSTTAQNIEATAKSLCRVLNRDPGSVVYAWYVSGILESPGQIVIEARVLGTVSFTLTCNNSTTASKFSPTLPITGAAGANILESDNQTGINRLYFAKVDEPEAVPDLNWDPIGDDAVEGLRVLATRDSLMVVTREGLWRKSGVTERTFTIEALDLTIHARAPRTWVVGDNAVYGLSTTGIVRATEAGTQLISYQINNVIEKILTYPNYETLAHAVFYESESKYIIWLPLSASSTKAEIAYVYNVLNKRWAGPWLKPAKAAAILKADNRMHLSQGDTTFPYLLRERKALTDDLADYLDEEMDVTISAVGSALDDSGNTITTMDLTGYPYTQTPVAGWLIRKDPSALPYSKIWKVENPAPGEYRLYLEDQLAGLTPGTGKIAVAILQRVRWAPETAGNVSSMKQFSSVQVYMEKGTGLHSSLGFFSDVDPEEKFYGELKFPAHSAGEMVRDIVPQEFQYCRALSLIYENRYGLEKADLLEAAFDLTQGGTETMARST